MQFLRKYYLFFLIVAIAVSIDIGSKYLVFRHLEGKIFVPVMVGTIPASYEKELSPGQITPILEKQLRDLIPVSSQTVLERQPWLSGEWWIIAEKERYLLVSANPQLQIYRSQEPIPSWYILLGPRLLAPDHARPMSVIPNFFALRLAFNLGAVWSSFEGKTLFLTSCSILAMIFILYLVFFSKYVWYYQISFASIMAGAIGNLWDRSFFGGVRDFLDFYIGRYHWPTFNFADTFIVVGIVLFLWWEWRKPQPATNQENTNKTAQ